MLEYSKTKTDIQASENKFVSSIKLFDCEELE